jgi:VanZ family protein
MNYPKNIMKWIVQPVWFISIVLVGYLSLTPRIEIPYPFSGADKLAHCLAYAWLAILPFFGFARVRAAFTGALLMVPLGIGLEFAQRHVPGRDFSIADMIADSAGVVLGIVVARYVKKRPYFGKACLVDCRKITP